MLIITFTQFLIVDRKEEKSTKGEDNQINNHGKREEKSTTNKKANSKLFTLVIIISIYFIISLVYNNLYFSLLFCLGYLSKLLIF